MKKLWLPLMTGRATEKTTQLKYLLNSFICCWVKWLVCAMHWNTYSRLLGKDVMPDGVKQMRFWTGLCHIVVVITKLSDLQTIFVFKPFFFSTNICLKRFVNCLWIAWMQWRMWFRGKTVKWVTMWHDLENICK